MGNITQAEMQTADVIVSTGTGAASGVIRAGTVSSFSHAALYAGNGQIIEAIGEGVVKQSLGDALQDDVLAVVYRRQGLSSAQAAIVVSYASGQVGKSYDYAGVAGSSGRTVGGTIGRMLFFPLGVIQGVTAAANMLSPESSFFCSELVLRAFEQADARITFMPATLSTPSDIPGSHNMQYVGHLKGG
ncbi:MAG: YiiX/YebB-like N1pC/P60 family cysteine hydrolase [Bryobacterales bacterium]|nr:YiiX/YebB-like N1pC/P60 family cysteine hydrolase [Bryobacterales bacterium]